MGFNEKFINKKIFFWGAGLLICLGVVLRLYRITAPEFLFYDEGMYLGYNRAFLHLVEQNPPHSFNEFLIISGLLFKNALATAKAFWFYLLNLRVFVTGVEGYFVARLISAVAGLAAVSLTFFFARRYFNSSAVGLLSAAILLFLPSHVFYSRLGMQESLSTLLFMTGIYLYYFSPRGVSLTLLLSALVMGIMYFTNYRMIIAPIFIICIQLGVDLMKRSKIDFLKMVVFVVVFLTMVLGIGSLYGGINNYVNFGWMANQAQEAGAHRQWINFLSFPYYIFKLDGVLLGLSFFSVLYLVFKKRFDFLLPAGIALLQMLLFSFAAEKGARYLCVVLPFIAMAAAFQIQFFYEKNPTQRKLIVLLIVLMGIGFFIRDLGLAVAKTDYQKAVEFVISQDPQAKMLSTQPLVESLYVQDETRIKAFPKVPQELQDLLAQGYRYLLIDPQVYVSWTDDQRRFSKTLIPPLEMIARQLKPTAVFDHIQEGSYLERFVLDHNQDLPQSLQFLKEQAGRGKIYVYDLKTP